MSFPSGRLMLSALMLSGVLATLGCSGSSSQPNPTVDAGTGCAPCGSGLGCDSTTHTCVAAASAGGYCGTSVTDGGPSACLDGLTCGPVADGTSVCARACNSSADCDAGQGCFANPSTVAARQYCADEVGEGAPCSVDHLQECVPSNGEVLECLGDNVVGTCFARCATSTDCGSGQGCSAAFSDGYGVCITPTQDGSSCNETTASGYVLCSAGQVCVTGASGTGICHPTCGADAGTCSAPEVCTLPNPCEDSTGFCIVPASQGGACNPADGQFCGPSDQCVDLGSGYTCELDCTAGEACPSGLTCHALPATDGGFICKKACF